MLSSHWGVVMTKEEKQGTEYHQKPHHNGEDPVGHVDHVSLLGSRVFILLYLYNLNSSMSVWTKIDEAEFSIFVSYERFVGCLSHTTKLENPSLLFFPLD